MKIYEILKDVNLFNGLESFEIESVLKCLNSNIIKIKSQSYLICEGESINYIGIVLSGELEIQKVDYFGNLNIIKKVYSKELIGASLSISSRLSPFDIYAKCDTTLLCINPSALSKSCPKACIFHTTIIRNLLKITASNNIELTNKIQILTKRTTKEKIIAYLELHKKNSKSNKITLTMNRQEMADYLSINRSALSRELSIMKDEGLIDFKDNIFYLLKV